MKKICYSSDAIKKIQHIEKRVRREFGTETAQKVKETITKRIRTLEKNEEQGISMYEMYGILPDYRRLFVAHNYIFYLIEENSILIVDLFHEKEDYMYKLFGISSIDEESEAYWDDTNHENNTAT